MIKPKCDACGLELRQQGGLAFSPPDARGRVRKLHFCTGCWDMMKLWLMDHHKSMQRLVGAKLTLPKPTERTKNND